MDNSFSETVKYDSVIMRTDAPRIDRKANSYANETVPAGPTGGRILLVFSKNVSRSAMHGNNRASVLRTDRRKEKGKKNRKRTNDSP